MSTAVITAIVSWAVSFFLGGIVAFLIAKVKSALKREKALQNGMQSLLRNKLIDYHDKYMERGYCPIYVKESAQKSYLSYHELGGNGVVTKLYNDIIELPEEPPHQSGTR